MSEKLHVSERFKKGGLRTTAGLLLAASALSGCTFFPRIERNGPNPDMDDAVPQPSKVYSVSTVAPQQPAGLPEHVIFNPSFAMDDATFCHWRLGTLPAPITHLNPLRMRVDNRCIEGGTASTDTSPALDVHKKPTVTGDTVSVIANNVEVTPTCYTEGEEAKTLTDRSRVWVNVRTTDYTGFIPVVSLGGGFTTEQLSQLGLPHCA